MAGYVRQSVADIVNGENITAPPINAEFNQIQVAFTGDAGHTHDGTIGEGPKINLTTSITGYLPAAHGGVSGANNPVSVIDPTELDDADDGYAVGSIWINNNTDRLFVCMDNTVGSAIWHEVAAVSPQDQWLPKATGTVDLGSTDYAFRDINITGTLTSAHLNGTLGGTTPAQVQATNIFCDTITADNGDGELSIWGNLYGTLTGNHKGDVYSEDNTLVLNSGTDGTDATFNGGVNGSLTGTFSGSGSGDFTGTFTGNVNANGQKITNVADPTDELDVVNKQFLDYSISAGTNSVFQFREDAQKLAVHPFDTLFEISTGFSGYSALHYATAAENSQSAAYQSELNAADSEYQANLSKQIAAQKAALISNNLDATEQRLIGVMI